jgi:hypothetical protein
MNSELQVVQIDDSWRTIRQAREPQKVLTMKINRKDARYVVTEPAYRNPQNHKTVRVTVKNLGNAELSHRPGPKSTPGTWYITPLRDFGLEESVAVFGALMVAVMAEAVMSVSVASQALNSSAAPDDSARRRARAAIADWRNSHSRWPVNRRTYAH